MNSRTCKNGLRAIAGFSLAMTSCLSLAAEQGGANNQEEPAVLEELLVTAGLQPISAADVGTSVTVITREDIEQRQVRYLADLLRDVPGFTVSQAGGPGTQTQIRVRGSEANHLLVLMDGVRANDPASADEFQYQYALTANIERIEIIRGPQSATWGTDALSGVINIIRRKDVATQYASARAEYGSFDTLSLGADAGLTRKRFTLTGGVAYERTDGTNIARGEGEKDGSEVANLNAMLEVQASDAVKLVLSAQHVDAENDFDDFDYFATGLPTDADRVTKAKRNYLRGQARYDPQGSRWNGSFSINWLDSDNQNIYDGAWDSSTAAESLELRLRASVLLGNAQAGNHRLTFAIDRDDVDFAQRGIATLFGDPNQDQEYDVTGYATEYVGKPFEGFTWTASGRLDQFSDFDDAFTWQLAASHHITDTFKVRGAAGTGAKAPTFSERYGFFPDFFLGNPDLKPEKSSGWELGFDASLANHRYRLSAVWFDRKLRDEIAGFVFDLNTFFFTAVNKDGDSKRQGLELTFDGEVIDNLSFTASYTWLDATEQDSTGNDVREIRRPRHMANLAANYRFAGNRGHLNLNINYNGKQLDSFFPPPFFIQERVELARFLVVDLAVSWKLTDSIEVVGRISNLFDEDYEEILGFARPGRAVYAGLRGRFSL